MANLFDDIINKATAPPTPSEDKEHIAELIDTEYTRLMGDRDYLHRRFHWDDLTDNQRRFYIDNVIMPQAAENVWAPINEAKDKVHKEKAAKDRTTYLTKMSTDKSVILYVDGKRKQFVDTMKVKCPDCGELLPVPSYGIGDEVWRRHINALAHKGKDDMLGIVFNPNQFPAECAACKTNHIVVVVVAP